MNDRRSMEKELKQKEDEKVKAFWRVNHYIIGVLG
jgi:hypothetical protein